ncbi:MULTISPECIES: hypothetical protein [unclassified Chryseobacterium]|uniref:hypothetical protein n=1 Tax=unclassified Chryseobacterium TaxID=2593645 RepID=UPI0028532A9D|nr:hypothetical protein [Chryseobacterium sp. CFS7]MDR4892715.1 hypothetical protein [Chryseobacterium sp. CFS7]
MNLKYGKQIEIESIYENNFDLFLFANNIEKRKLEAYNAIKKNNLLKRTIALNYCDSTESLIQNDSIENIRVDDLISIRKIIRDTILNSKNDELNIFVDYSCMTKPWYYTILSYLSEKNIENKTINCYFSYTPSIYSEPLPPKQNTKIEPVEGSYKIPNNKPKALIVCLGYEQNKAQGIIDQLEPKLTYLYYTDPSIDSKFVTSVKENNKDILKEIKDEFVFTYPFNDIKFLEKQLTSLYYHLREDYNIIIAPLGPKPFTFVAMILSIIFPEIEVWRVDSGLDLNRYTRESFDPPKFILNKIVFQQ